MPAIESKSSNAIQPELELERDGITVYRWQLSTGDILIEVFSDGSTKVNGETVDEKLVQPRPWGAKLEGAQ